LFKKCSGLRTFKAIACPDLFAVSGAANAADAAAALAEATEHARVGRLQDGLETLASWGPDEVADGSGDAKGSHALSTFKAVVDEDPDDPDGAKAKEAAEAAAEKAAAGYKDTFDKTKAMLDLQKHLPHLSFLWTD
jgi:hypothetical protein